MTSPLITLVGSAQAKMNGGEFGTFFNDQRRFDVLKSIVDGYYASQIRELEHPRVIFDTNRAWTSRLPLINLLYPQARVICCVRDIGWIIDSVEQALAKNPLQLSRIFGFQPGISIASRTEYLMNHEKGLVGLSWTNLREAWHSQLSHKLIVVPYENLVRDPENIMRDLYVELGEPYFSHDFSNVEYDEPEFDRGSGMPGLHKVHKTVAHRERPPCIPLDILNRFGPLHFWRQVDKNVCGAKVLS